MSNNFKALVVNQEDENFTREVKSIDKSFLKHGDVLVKVDYSDLNYKDALILNNGAKLVKEFPHIPGIDFAGTVLESDNSKFVKGDEVILTGWRVGEIYFGGYSQLSKVNGDFLVKKPKDISSKQAMILGTGLNILLDPIFIFDWGLGMGVRGAAIATVISQSFISLFNLFTKCDPMNPIPPVTTIFIIVLLLKRYYLYLFLPHYRPID